MDELISPSHRYLTHMPTLAVCMRPQTPEKTLALAATPPLVTSYLTSYLKNPRPGYQLPIPGFVGRQSLEIVRSLISGAP